MTEINRVILSTVKQWHRSPRAINKGYCFEFATLIFAKIEGSSICGHNVNGVGHSYVLYRGLYYDSECPQGTKLWTNLPFWRSIRKQAGEKEWRKALRAFNAEVRKQR